MLTPEEEKEYQALEAKVAKAKQRLIPKGQFASDADELSYLEDKAKTSALKQVGKVFRGEVANIGNTIKRSVGYFLKEKEEAKTQVMEGIQKPGVLKTPWDVGMGALRYVTSPITGAAKGMVEEPITETLKDVGVNENIANIAGETSGLLSQTVVPIGGLAKAAAGIGKTGLEGLQAAQKMGMVQKTLGKAKNIFPDEAVQAIDEIKPSTVDSQIKGLARKVIDSSEGVVPKSATPVEVMSPTVKTGIVDDIAKGATDALSGKLDESNRIFKQIGESLAIGEIEPEYIPGILSKHNITPVEFAKEFEQTISSFGRGLGFLGRAKRQIMAAMKDYPDAMAILEKGFSEYKPTLMDNVYNKYLSVENFRRSMLVTQAVTSMRNTWSNAQRMATSALDEGLQAAISKGMMGEDKFAGSQFIKATGEEIRRDFNGVCQAFGLMKNNDRDKLMQVFETAGGTMAKAKLLSQPVHEVTMGGKISHAANTLNRMQEFFFRRIAFESRLRQNLAKKGMSYNTVNPEHIPDEMLQDAVKYGLEMTYALPGQSQASRTIINAWTKVPGLTLINPFPRFNFGNMIPFLAEHSPLGYLHAIRPEAISELASGNPAKFAKAASRATIGTMMTDSAVRLRQSEYAGDRYYEVIVGKNDDGSDRVVDLRSFPHLSFYSFLAEHFVHPERIKPSDYFQMMLGLNRVAGTGLVVADWLRAKSGESFDKQFQNFVGQYSASFTVPLRTTTDVYGAFDEEENRIRDTKEDPLLSPLFLNLPKISQIVPENPSAHEPGTRRKVEDVTIMGKTIPGGVWRQMTGLPVERKGEVESELDKLMIDYSKTQPRTGVPRADRRIKYYMAKEVDALVKPFIKTKDYNKYPVEEKRIIVGKIYEEIKRRAKMKMALEDPGLALKVWNKQQDQDIQKILMRYPQYQQLMGGL